MKVYGLIGFPLHHSFSKFYFNEKFKRENIQQAVYKNFPLLSISELPKLLEDNKDIVGLNVTIPYKEQIIPLLSNTDELVREIRAVNTIVVKRNDNRFFLHGYNTDVFGFEKSLKNFNIKGIDSALVLGNGGAAKAVKYVLKKLAINVLTVVRNPKTSHEISFVRLTDEIIDKNKLIINCTPVGTSGNNDVFPFFPYEAISNQHFVFDLVYNPPLTKLLQIAQTKGAVISNGYDMLKYQAEQSWKIWNTQDK